MSGAPHRAPTASQRFARTPTPSDRRPALTRDFGQRDLRTKCVISYRHREAQRDRSPCNPAEFFTAVRTPVPAVDKNENRRVGILSREDVECLFDRRSEWHVEKALKFVACLLAFIDVELGVPLKVGHRLLNFVFLVYFLLSGELSVEPHNSSNRR